MSDSKVAPDAGDSVDEERFRAEAQAWLGARLARRETEATGGDEASDDVAVFHSLPFEEERALLERGLAWQKEKFEAGYGAISMPPEYGGAALPESFERAFREEEATFELPANHEALRITTNLVAPTIRALGTEEQGRRFIPRFLGGEALACQLFSEPDAGSDLAAVATRAVRDGDGWLVTGSKVWASGAQFAQWGELIARTDPDVPKHAGLTAFLLPMDAPGVEVRPIRQMSGGSSFNEVFLRDVRIPDDLRLGEPGRGWHVALTTLGFERGQSGAKVGVGASWEQLLALAVRTGGAGDPVVRQRLMAVYTHERLRRLTRERAEAARRAGAPPGPEGSLGKLLWVQGLMAIGEVAADLLGPSLAADTGAPGTFAWNHHVLGAPGFRIAGGSDEIQRNILAERVLGLPGEPRVDRDVPWRAVVRSGRPRDARGDAEPVDATDTKR